MILSWCPFLLNHFTDKLSYYKLVDKYKEDVSFLNEFIGEQEATKFTFELRIGEPIVYQMNKLNEFYDTMKLIIKWHSKIFKVLTNGVPSNQFINDFERDKAGNVKNIDKMFAEWDKYLFVYRYHKEGKKHKDIYKLLLDTSFGAHEQKKSTVASEGSAERVINEYLRYAKKLIASAENGKFPDIND